MNLLLDMGGVLMQHNLPGCIEAFTRIMGAQAMQQVLGLCPNGEGLPHSIMEDFECGLICEDDFVNRIWQACYPGTTRDQVVQAWVMMHGGIPAERLQFVRQWHQQGHHILLLSNSNALHEKDIRENYDISFFDQCFFSHHLGVIKPHRDFYLSVVRYLHSQGWDMLPTLFVDDIAANRLAGEAFGWATAPSLQEAQKKIISI